MPKGNVSSLGDLSRSDLTAEIGLHPQGEREARFRFECAGGAVAVTTDNRPAHDP